MTQKNCEGLTKFNTFKRRVFVQEEAAQKEQRFLTGRQVAQMIYDNFKVLDTDDLNEILKIELKNDNVQSFNTRWDEIIIAMKKQPDDEMLEKCVLS